MRVLRTRDVKGGEPENLTKFTGTNLVRECHCILGLPQFKLGSCGTSSHGTTVLHHFGEGSSLDPNK